MPKLLYDTVEGSARLLQSPDLGKALESVGPLVADAQTLLKRLDREVGPLITSLKGTSNTARASLVDITQQLDRVAADTSRLMMSLTETSETARGTVKDLGPDLQKTLAQLAALTAKLHEVGHGLAPSVLLIDVPAAAGRQRRSSRQYTKPGV